MRERPGYPGEDPARQMQKLARSNSRVTCGSCRQFEGQTWCRHWNFHTAADAPICPFYKALSRGGERALPDVSAGNEDG
jgi:hypothetical protein